MMLRADAPRPSGPNPMHPAAEGPGPSWPRDMRRACGALAPWMGSFVFHLGLVALGLALVWMVYDSPPDRSVPLAWVAPRVDPIGWKITPKKTPTRCVLDGPASWRVNADRIASEMQMARIQEASLLTQGHKKSPAMAWFGLGRTRGSGFFGCDWSAPTKLQKVTFLIDASGSLVEAMPFVEKQLLNTIGRMPVGQPFNVIFFCDGKAVEVPRPNPGMKRAGLRTQIEFAQWLSGSALESNGRTDPRQAIRLAVSQKPQQLIILSDNITGTGRFEIDQAELIAFLDGIEGPRPVIHTIQFLQPDPLQTLARIARRFGGIHKYVDEKDLGLSK